MKSSYATRRLNVSVGNSNKSNESLRSGPLDAADRPSTEELDAFYSDPSSLAPDRLIAVEQYVQGHRGGEGARAEYLRYRRRLQTTHRHPRQEAIED
jgi:hypothetical protein